MKYRLITTNGRTTVCSDTPVPLARGMRLHNSRTLYSTDPCVGTRSLHQHLPAIGIVTEHREDRIVQIIVAGFSSKLDIKWFRRGHVLASFVTLEC